MSKQSEYARAVHVQQYMNARDGELSVIPDRDRVNISVGGYGWRTNDVKLLASLTEETLDRLMPAFSAIFNKILADKIATLNAEAIAEVETEQAEAVADAARKLRELRGQPEPQPGVSDGETCNRDGCPGVIIVPPSVNCSCHISSPCVACRSRQPCCPECGWECTDAA